MASTTVQGEGIAAGNRRLVGKKTIIVSHGDSSV